MKNKKEKALLSLSLLLLGVVVGVLYKQAKHYSYQKIMYDLNLIPRNQILLSIFFVFISYFILTLYDALALRYLKKPIPFYKTFFASFTGYAFAHNIGFTFISGGSVRYRFYSTWGLKIYETALVTAFVSATIWLGYFVISALLFLSFPIPLPTALSKFQGSIPYIGIFFIFIYLLYAYFSYHQSRFHTKNFEFQIPSLKFLSIQTPLSMIDWCCAAFSLYVLFPQNVGISYPLCLWAYLLAICVGQIAHIPGGLGVFEGIILLFVSPALNTEVPHETLLASLVIFRITYYVLPLVLSFGVLGVFEIAAWIKKLKKEIL